MIWLGFVGIKLGLHSKPFGYPNPWRLYFLTGACLYSAFGVS